MIADLLLAANFVFQKKYQKTAFDGLSYMLQLIGAESLPASVLYPFITGGSIILTSFAGVAVFKEKLTIRQWLAVAVCFVGTLLFL